MLKKYIICILILFLGFGALFATTAKRMSLDELIKNSVAIVQCKVKTLSTAWDKGKKTIWTKAEIEIIKTHKGKLETPAKIYLRGGTVDGKTQTVSGAAKLKTDEEAMLFLWKDKQNRLQVLGMIQGKFKILRTEDKKVFVENSYQGLMLVDDKGKSAPKKNYLPMKMKLADFEAEIKKIIDKSKENKVK